MMTYAEFLRRPSFTKTEILAFAHGTLINDPPHGFACRLPLPPMLMVDRIREIERHGRRGRIVAERDVRLEDWFFQCHFQGDPVQPGCLGVDAIWQLIGFFCARSGAIGAGRALGCKEISFEGQIRPLDSLVRYEVEIQRYARLTQVGGAMAIGSARVFVDRQCIYTIEGAKVGIFRGIAYNNYPEPGPRARGGRMRTEDQQLGGEHDG